MAITIIVEDGTAKTDANSYISRADANSYLEAHAEAATWAALSDAAKDALLVRGTRALDDLLSWAGYRVTATQALEWPRQGVPWAGPHPSVEGQPQTIDFDTWPTNQIPTQLKAATAEAAAFCMANNPGAQPDSAGIKKLGLGDGAIDIEFDATTTPPPLPAMITAKLKAFVSGGGRKGSMKVRRA